MRNAGLEEAQAGIKIAGRNIDNPHFTDEDTEDQRGQLAAGPRAQKYLSQGLNPGSCEMELLPAISVNKDVTVIRDSSPPNVNS